ncbi:MAG: hypothetical protein KGH64_01240 [Candidatus Micrarchaeota archaeon]|nr:hypothetical protein [Candidatus Micrarchaeota archaeon]MDE1833942.1 hypothetical protein [Candidatus Micrarchaeota archaeon]MDE1859659.1 hypothetical protein [Candidatus Micrarchaeota archaeon]
MVKYCIMCGKQRNGLAVADDSVLEAMRWFKRNVTKNEQKNALVVCKECYQNYAKARSRYTSRRALYLIIGGAFLVMAILISFSLVAIIAGVAVVIIMYFVSLLNYIPDLKIYADKANAEKNKA